MVDMEKDMTEVVLKVTRMAEVLKDYEVMRSQLNNMLDLLLPGDGHDLWREGRRHSGLLGRQLLQEGHTAGGRVHLRQCRIRPHLRDQDRRLCRLLGPGPVRRVLPSRGRVRLC